MTRRSVANRASPRAPAAPWYQPIYARVLCSVASARGIDSLAVLAAAGLSEEAIGANAPKVSYEQMGALIGAIQQKCGDPRLALDWGTRLGIHVHGIAGAAFLSSRDVRQAITVLCALATLRSTTVRVSVVESDAFSWLEIAEALPLYEQREFLLAALAVMLSQLLGVVLGNAHTRVLIELPLPAAGWSQACSGYFPSTTRFDAPALRFGFPVELLDQACPTADADAHAAAMRQCALDTMGLSGKLTARINAYLAQQVGNFPTMAAAASDFCLSERTLSRCLREEGATYQSLLDAARLDAARRYLGQTNLAVEQIAERLGYADPSNFIRAFRRWCGKTPQQYRKYAEP